MADSNALEGLTQALRKLPGVGAKSAARMAFHLLQHDKPGALQIARALEDDFSQLERNGQERELTILFSDVRNFTGFSEAHSARAVVRLPGRGGTVRRLRPVSFRISVFAAISVRGACGRQCGWCESL